MANAMMATMARVTPLFHMLRSPSSGDNRKVCLEVVCLGLLGRADVLPRGRGTRARMAFGLFPFSGGNDRPTQVSLLPYIGRNAARGAATGSRTVCLSTCLSP